MRVPLAVRTLLRRPALLGAALLTLGIAVTAGIVTLGVADPLFLRDLPFRDAGRLVIVHEIDRGDPTEEKLVSPADFHDLRDLGVFDSTTAWMNWNFNLRGVDVPRRLIGSLVTPEIFETLGRAPARGRPFRAEDALPGAAPVVVISDRLWREVFLADPELVGKTIDLGGDPVEIIGILPSGLSFPEDEVDLWTPLVFGVHFEREDRGGRNLRVIARIRDGASLEETASALAVLSARLATTSPQTHADWSLHAVPLREAWTREIRPAIALFGLAALLLLLLAVANTTNLLLMLAVSRRKEIATQAAIGAGTLRIALGTLQQALVLGLGAFAIAAASSAVLLPLIGRLGIDLPFAVDPSFDLRMGVFALAASLLAACASSIAPAVLVLRVPLLGVLRETVDGGERSVRLRRALVVVQIGIASTLLVGAALLGRSLVRLLDVDPGFDPRNVVTARVWLPGSYRTSAEQFTFFDEVLRRIEEQPGVASAAAIQDLPLRENAMTFELGIEGEERDRKAAWRVVSANYFETMSIPILRGRGIEPRDDGSSPRIAVINHALAVRAFGASDPVGRRIRVGDDGAWATIVGVAGDVRHRGLAAEEIPAVYEPLAQKDRDFLRWMTLAVRTSAAPSTASAAAIRSSVLAVDPRQPVYEVETMEELMRRTTARPRIAATLVGSFAAASLLIALVGIGGVLSYAVTLRRRELGVRAAIGATPARIARLVLTEAAILVGGGAGLGLLLAAIAAPVLDRFLFETAFLEAAVLGAVAAAVIVSSIAAVAPAALRAARTDPARTLRA